MKTEFRPHPYQRRAIKWILEHQRCGLFMEMGLGKSVCTLTAIQTLMEELVIARVLVIAPKKVAESTWSDEAEKWSHLDLRVSKVMGTPAQRQAALAADADIYVLGRDSVVWLASQKHPHFDVIVIDELTSFKSPRSQRFKAFKKLRKDAVRIIGLTGTPAPNGLLDLWAQIYCLDGGLRLGPYVTQYRDTYFTSVMHNHIPIKVIPKNGAQEAITSKISDICFSMRAEEYLELPPMEVRDRRVQLPDIVMARYGRFERERVAWFKAAAGNGHVTAANAAALINKLAQFANGAVYGDDGTVHPIHTAKIEMLLELMESAASPVLCFYAYRSDEQRIMSALPERIKVRKYENEQDLRDWNAGKIDLLLAHPASTAYGLNMQKGGHVIVWFSTGWNLELYQQANARLYRQGQRLPVTVYNLIASGTVDERMAAALTGKAGTQESVVKKLAMSLI